VSFSAALVSGSAFSQDFQSIAQQIRSANRDYEASVNTLKADFTIDAEHFGPSMMGVPKATISWVKSGRRELLYTDPHFDYGENAARLWNAWTGRQSIYVGFYTFDRNLMNIVIYEDVFPDCVKQFSMPALVLGWRMRGMRLRTLDGQSIPLLIQDADPNKITQETARVYSGPDHYDEFPAYKWVVKRFEPESPNGSGHTLTVWFDPENSWLPRMWTYYPDLTASGGWPEDSNAFGAAVGEFITVDDPLLKAPRHFPKTMYTYGGLDNLKCTLLNIQLNEPIAASMFEPVITGGAEIVHNPGTRRELKTYHGGEEGEKLFAEYTAREMAGSAPQELQNSPSQQQVLDQSPVNASPDAAEPTSWSVVLLAISIMAFIGVIWFRLRS
jgi:hypothetical protein